MTRQLTIARPLPISQITVSGGGDGAGLLLTPDPKEVYAATTTGTRHVDIDLGTMLPIDTVFIGFTNADAAATWIVDRTTSMAGEGAVRLHGSTSFRVLGSQGQRHHALALLAAPAETRYLRIRITQPAGTAPIQIGAVIVAQRFDHAYEYKSGRRPIDLSERVDLSGGGFGFGRGAIKSAFRFTFSDLSDTEVADLWNLLSGVGNQHPALLIEGGTVGVDHNQIHYGVFERFEAYEREDPADTRWSLQMQDWI